MKFSLVQILNSTLVSVFLIDILQSQFRIVLDLRKKVGDHTIGQSFNCFRFAYAWLSFSWHTVALPYGFRCFIFEWQALL